MLQRDIVYRVVGVICSCQGSKEVSKVGSLVGCGDARRQLDGRTCDATRSGMQADILSCDLSGGANYLVYRMGFTNNNTDFLFIHTVYSVLNK